MSPRETEAGCVRIGVALALAFLASLGFAGCAADGEPIADAPDQRGSIVEEDGDAGAPVEREGDDRTPAEASGEAVLVRRDTELIGEDGRPTWWFREPASHGGVVIACGEALAETFAQARTRAIEAARASASDHAESVAGASEPAGVRIDRAIVLPLRHRSTIGPQYAGYAKVVVEMR